ncbi:MAG: hypothetical protein ACYC3F_09490 [Gemmatimonadaceae bacterium]
MKPDDSEVSADSLREELQAELKAGRALWLRMDGAGLEDRLMHQAFTGSLARCGVGAERTPKSPTTLVLDWSKVASVSADGLAHFAVLMRHGANMGLELIVCGPSEPDLKRAVEAVSAMPDVTGGRWVQTTQRDTRPRVRVLSKQSVFSPCDGEPRGFLNGLSAWLNEQNVRASAKSAVISCVMEILLNIRTHSGADVAAAVVLELLHRRPHRLQIGFADNGIGIVNSMLENPHFAGLEALHPATAADSLLMGTRTRRDDGRTDEFRARGGLGQVVRCLVEGTRATAAVRSGSALLTFSCDPGFSRLKYYLDYGLGTVWKLEVVPAALR